MVVMRRSLFLVLGLSIMGVVVGCTQSSTTPDAPGAGDEVTSASAGTRGVGSAGASAGTTSSAGTGVAGAGVDVNPAGGAAGAATAVAGGGSGGANVDASSGVPVAGSTGLAEVSSDGDGLRTIGPDYTPDPRLQDPAAPKGTQFDFTMTGAESEIYPGLNGNYNREVTVYVPAQYDPAKPAAFIVTQDALGKDVLPGLLDNMINQKMLPVIVVIFANNGGGDAPGSERGLEYDTVSGLYAEYAITEMIPRVIVEAQGHNIDLKLTDDPNGHGTFGGSSGGAGSFSMAWWHPDYFRRVVTYSGTYVRQVPADSPFPNGCWVYHDFDPYDDTGANGLILQDCEPVGGFTGSSNPGPCDTPLSQPECEAVTGCQWNTTVNRPLRVWLESAENDLGAGGNPSTHRNFDLANQRMADALESRGYHYHYDHALNAGHVDSKVIRQTIVEAMLWVWRGYPIE